ncbi:RNA polymerase sigma factor [Prosthecobacter sp.]|uniref:RNA polymerase sigma factor n=1 Tax=Prosthecobacter sp. TaxID=1965333 RepID=UPI0037848DB3
MPHSNKKNPQADSLLTRATLINGLGGADDKIWLDFYKLYEGVIRGMARKWNLGEEASWDVVQDVMLQINRVSKSFLYDRDKRVFIANAEESAAAIAEGREFGGFRQWLFTVIKRAIWKRYNAPRRKREVLFSDMADHDADQAQAYMDSLTVEHETPDALLEKKSQDAYSLSLFEQAIRLLPSCTKKAHPRKIAIFLALKQPHVFAAILEAPTAPLPPAHMTEMKALNRLPRDESGVITKSAILKHYDILSNHLDQEVRAVKKKLASIYTDLQSGRDPRVA